MNVETGDFTSTKSRGTDSGTMKNMDHGKKLRAMFYVVHRCFDTHTCTEKDATNGRNKRNTDIAVSTLCLLGAEVPT